MLDRVRIERYMAVACPKTNHCACCVLLPTSQFLNPNEVSNIGCCGLDPNDCFSFSQELTDVFLEVATHAGGNNCRRYAIYSRTFANLASVAVNGGRRSIFPACVLHRVRCAYPNPFGVPYVGHRQHQDDESNEESSEEETEEEEGDPDEGDEDNGDEGKRGEEGNEGKEESDASSDSADPTYRPDRH